MNEEKDCRAQPDEIRLHADTGRALLANQMKDLGKIAQKAKRNTASALDLRGDENQDNALLPCGS